MQKNYDRIVVSGGFRSMIAAYALAKQGHSVLLVEAMSKLGGFMTPIRWRDFWIDKGPQFFDNFEDNDRAFIDEMLGTGLLESIGFSYASYMDGVKTDNFAIPDWRTRGPEFTNAAFADILADRIAHPEPARPLGTVRDVVQRDGGAALNGELSDLVQKFLRRTPDDLGTAAGQMVTLFGRKLFFDQDVSINLKKSPLLDGILAAEKATVGETRYNLYPRGTSLETVRLAMESALKRVGVDVKMETQIKSLDGHTRVCTFEDGSVGYDQIFFGGDCRETEQLLLGTNTLSQNTHLLPEIFHCFVVPTAAVDDAYYLIDYDINHLSTRMTNFCNYMDARDAAGNGVICVEQPVDRDSEDWNSPERLQDKIFQEVREAGNVSCDTYLAAKSFSIPVTYKVPLAGFAKAWEDVEKRIAEQFGRNVILPDAATLTRKQTMDDLRQLGILNDG
jgi:protoporphyrinogen oxidase